MSPDLVFANAEEWEALRWTGPAPFDLVLKHGKVGAELTVDGVTTMHPARTVEATDATGAGDSLAAGYLVADIELAMRTAAECVQTPGAQPLLILPSTCESTACARSAS